MAETALPLARKAADVLAERGVENARLEAELLLAWVLGIGRLQLYLQHDRPVSDAELERFRAAVRRRLKHEPVQYIVGTAHFRQLELRVDRRVLIPRPETEELVGAVLEWARRSDGAGERRLTALDLGTGSGAIALSLAKEGPFRRVVATDVSAAALELARENADALGLGERIELRAGSLWDAVLADERFDVIVSNPPYVAERDRATLAPEVLEWEPAGALFGGAAGYDVIEPLVRGAPSHLAPGGLLAVEVGLGQAAAVAERIDETGAYEGARVLRDLAGRERMVLAAAPGSVEG
ncbi:MAG TPA: peptide chain release factor N(5)-glutamine methyltransferase [Longimicrobiales bacterium]|nr:peptide chain release factor N(5)-glutamine methyltransferase [Longimicrobiales bacterium]